MTNRGYGRSRQSGPQRLRQEEQVFDVPNIDSAQLKITRLHGKPPLISVIIPSLDGSRGGNVDRLKADLARQTVQDYELIIVIRVRPNGRARNVGVREAKGKYLVCIDDDVQLGDDHVLENLLRPFQERTDVGLSGASQLIPEDSNPFQKAAAQQLGRCMFPIQKQMVDSDMVSHMCLCMPTQLYKDIGWENEIILSGTDPDLRHRVREAGLRVVVVPNTWAYHPMPETRQKLWRMCFKKGRDSAWVQEHHPEFVLELDAGFRSSFPARRCKPYRILRHVFTLIWAIMTGKCLLVASRMQYALGHLHYAMERRDG